MSEWEDYVWINVSDFNTPAWVDWFSIVVGLFWHLCAIYGIWSIIRWLFF